MKITIWGCRGSIPSSGPSSMRYGGNTTCVEVRSKKGQVVVLDAGSGARLLGRKLVKEDKAKNITILFTHSHWDHLVGFPFFLPAYLKQYTLTLCGGPSAQQSIGKYLARQMEPPFFPVDFSVLKAKIIMGCQCTTPHCIQRLSGAKNGLKCSSIPLSHPNGGYGFRLAEGGKSFVFIPDNELGFHHKGGLSLDEYADFCRDADLLFHDAQYTDQEYEETRGWGHSTYAHAMALALRANVKRLGLFHHDPDRTDKCLDMQVEWCRRQIRKFGKPLECFACAEGAKFDL